MNINIKITKPKNCSHYGVSAGDIISIDLEEEYLPMCVSNEIYESNSRTSMEAKIAQAIAARSYILSFINEGKVIDDTTTYQSFEWKDKATIPNTCKAVEDSRTQVLVCGEEIIRAWYASSNGGRCKRSDEAWSTYKPWTVSQDDQWDILGREKWGQLKAQHGVGMSQIGASYAAFIGKSHEEILEFYYPNTKILSNYGKENGMLNVDKLVQSFREIVGWPYVTPGTNDKNGIDCSGAFVRAYKQQNASIYHGSNRIVRVHCDDSFKITSVDQLEPGMAVFKWRNDGGEPSDYKPGGRYYDPNLTGNFYHIGLVVSINPFQIIHAGVPNASIDTSVSGKSGTPPWSWAGHLSAVEYSGSITPPITPPKDGEIWGTVTTVSGGLNMREQPSSNGAYMLSIPKGSRILLLRITTENGETWGLTEWIKGGTKFSGWVNMNFVTMDSTSGNEPDPGDEPGDTTIPEGYVLIEKSSIEALISSAQALLRRRRR